MKLKLKREDISILEKNINNYNHICGIDEVGRGCIAGPVVSCAIVMGKNRVDGVVDSKKISDKKRRSLVKEIYSNAIAIGIGIVDSDIVDQINIRQAALLSMKKALEDLKIENQNFVPDLVLIDAENIDTDIDQIGIISGDDLVYEISCASIVAKVFRDDIMIDYSKKYPDYMFESHKGYGTKKHYQAIEKYGLLDIHRKTFMKKYYEKLQAKSYDWNIGRADSDQLFKK